MGLVLLAALATVGADSDGPRPRPTAAATEHVAPTAADRGAPSPAGPGTSTWQTGQMVPLAVTRGRAEVDLPAPGPGSRTLVIVSALSRESGPFPIRLSARPTTRLREPERAAEPAAREVRLKPAATPAIPDVDRRHPPVERTFHLMVREGDVASASNYLAVRGRLRAVGQRVQVYVDAQDVAVVGEEVLRDLLTTFDGRVFPTAATLFGRARDVDGDGRFTVLLTSWLTRLGGGRHAVDGFVRGADFDATLASPFGNRCDMMYLSTALEPGPHLRTVVAHEYTHAVTLTAKAFSATAAAGGVAGRPHLEEEGWLDEALAHLVEDLHGFSRSNLDYRVSAFLSQPSRYQLVVGDYYAADLFRSHGNRGGTYLFLRWCADRFGPSLLPTLIRSDRRGTDNLEAATGLSFAELYRQWSAALYLSGLEPAADHGRPAGYRSLDLRAPLGRWELAGPRPLEATPGASGTSLDWRSAGTSSQFVVVKAPTDGAPAVVVEVSGPPEADLQVTAVPLPSSLADVELGVRAASAPDGTRQLLAQLRERRGSSVRLTGLAWEPLVPSAYPRAAGFRRDGLDADGIARAFGTATLPPLGTLKARAIPLPDCRDPLVIKLVGIDASGRRVAAWAELPAVADVDDEASHDEISIDPPAARDRSHVPHALALRQPRPSENPAIRPERLVR